MLGLLRALAADGLQVQPFKSGPDYIDPAFHTAATGRASWNLDSWAMAPARIGALIGGAEPADLVLAEGSMGLFDGVARPGALGRGSSADAIIAEAGAVNAASAVDGFKPVTDEGIIAAAPDVVLMMARGNHAANPAEVFALPAFSATPAATQKALVTMDGLYLLGFGPRTPQAARDLMAAVYGGGRRP